MYLQVHVIASLILCLLLFMAGSQGQSTDNSTSSSTTSSTVSSTISSTVSSMASSSMNSTAAAQNSTFSTVSSTAGNASTSNTTNSTTFPDTTTVVATTTIITTTMKPSFDMIHNRDRGYYVLELTVSMDNLSDIQYTNASLTRDDMLKKVKNSVLLFPGASIDLYATGQEFTLRLFFPLYIITNDSEQTFANVTKADISLLTASGEFKMPNENSTFTKIDAFFSLFRNICAAVDVCPLGFSCNSEGCQHMCATRDCSGHGTCFINVNSSATATAMCKCDDEYANEYTGDNCEYARRGRWQIIAILAAVLGTACLIFIIIIIVMCVCYGRNKASANYNFSGESYHTNNAYDNSRDK